MSFKIGEWVRVSVEHSYWTGRVGHITAIFGEGEEDLTWVGVTIDDNEVTFKESEVTFFEKAAVELESGKETRDDIQGPNQTPPGETPEHEDL